MPDASRRLFDAAPIALYELDLRRLVAWLDAGGYRAHPDRLGSLADAEIDAALALVTILDANDVAVRWAGATRAEIVAAGPNPVNRRELLPLLHALARGAPSIEHETALAFGGVVRRVLTRVEFTPQAIEAGRVVMSGVDVTDARRAAEELHDARRLESLVLLAGSVAHDFNNLLTIARLNIDRLARREPAAEGRELERLRDATTRGAALARQLLLFSRRELAQATIFDPDLVLAGLEPLLRRTLDPRIAIAIEHAPNTVGIDMDPAQLEQIVHNLALNAADAMTAGGTLRIVRGRRDDVVTIAVIDTGPGIDAAVHARVFEPFFTTQPGKRAGLGLSIVHGIVTRAGGTIALDSDARGTRVEIALPVARLAASSPEIAISGTERILLVEDEDGVRDVTRATLEEAGYRVVAARNGDEAIATADGEIDLVISDLVMPGLAAVDLVGRLRTTRPALPVLYISGHAADGPPATDGPGPVAFLAKPFTADQLLRSVRGVLP